MSCGYTIVRPSETTPTDALEDEAARRLGVVCLAPTVCTYRLQILNPTLG